MGSAMGRTTSTVLAAASAFLIHAGISAALGQELDLSLMQMAQGDCVADVGQTDIGCDRHAVYSKFRNGRNLIDFTGTVLATIGFAGAKVVSGGDGETVLWLDRVYLNQKPSEADGQCSLGKP